jgi:hypothetical protein
VVGEGNHAAVRIVVGKKRLVIRYHAGKHRMGIIDLLQVEKRVKNRMRDIDLDPVILGQYPPHLSGHVVPLRGLEVVEENQAALQQVQAQILRLGI